MPVGFHELPGTSPKIEIAAHIYRQLHHFVTWSLVVLPCFPQTRLSDLSWCIDYTIQDKTKYQSCWWIVENYCGLWIGEVHAASSSLSIIKRKPRGQILSSMENSLGSETSLACIVLSWPSNTVGDRENNLLRVLWLTHIQQGDPSSTEISSFIYSATASAKEQTSCKSDRHTLTKFTWSYSGHVITGQMF